VKRPRTCLSTPHNTQVTDALIQGCTQLLEQETALVADAKRKHRAGRRAPVRYPPPAHPHPACCVCCVCVLCVLCVCLCGWVCGKIAPQYHPPHTRPIARRPTNNQGYSKNTRGLQLALLRAELGEMRARVFQHHTTTVLGIWRDALSRVGPVCACRMALTLTGA